MRLRLPILLLFLTAFATTAFSQGVVHNVSTGVDYTTIQAAIDAATSNQEIKVDAGTYAERLIINKPLTIEGPNMGKAGDDITRVGEAQIIPPSTDLGSAPPLPLVKFEAGAEGSVFDGFEVNGDNPALSSGITVNGLQVDAAFGIMVESAGNITIENNLVQNFGSDATTPYAVSISVENTITGTALSGCIIKDNYIKNLNQPYASAILDGITFDYNCYGQVTNNKIENVREGIQFNNNFIANPDAFGFPAKIDNNNISSYRSGIYYNQQSGKGSPWTVSNNTLQSMQGPSENTLYEGIRVESVEDTVSGVIEGNTLIGNVDARTTENPSFTVTGISFKNNVSTTGTFLVKDNDISEMQDGIIYKTDNSAAKLTTNVKYEGGDIHDVQRDYVRYEIAAGMTTPVADVNLPSTKLDGKTGAEYTVAEVAGIESGKITDKDDNPLYGKVNFVFPVENVTQGTYYATIQDAVDDADPNDEIKVPAGTYAERIVVDKPLTIEGPNVGKAGDDATRVAEAKIIPPDTKISGEGTDGLQVPVVKFGPGSEGSSFDGFEVNGDNPTLPTSGVDVAGTGISVDAAFGIRVEGVGDVTIQNNVVENLGSKPISKFGYPYALGISAESTTPVSGILITGNYIKNLEQTDAVADLDAVMLINNAYAQVTSNKMDAVRIGVQFENQGMANPKATTFPAKVNDNDISSYRAGVYYNLQHPNASPWIVSGNALSSSANPTVNAIYEGIRVETIEGAVDATISGNTIIGNVADRMAENGSSIVTGISFKNNVSTTGTFLVKDNDISEVLDGIVYKTDNSAAKLTANVQYEGGDIHDVQRDYVRYEIAAGMTTPVADVNLPGTQLDEKTGAEYTAAEVASIESGKIIDKDDNPLYGKVNFVFPVENVTQTAYYATIQDAVDAANPNDEIKVPAGTYAERIVVDKPLTIEGPNVGKAGDDPTRVAEAQIIPPGTDFSSTTPLPLVTFEAGAKGSVLDGFEVNGDNPMLPSSGVLVHGLGVDAAFGVRIENTGGITIRNNVVQNFGSTSTELGYPYAVGIIAESTTPKSDISIRHNYIKNMDQVSSLADINGVEILNNAYAQVNDNKMDAVRVGVQFENQNAANPDNSFPAQVDSNDISSYKLGLYYNLQYSNASPWTVNHNTFQSIGSPGNTYYEGICIQSIQGAVDGAISNNTIIGNQADRIQENPAFVTSGIVFEEQVITTGTFTVKDNDISEVKDGIVYKAEDASAALTAKVQYEGGNIHDVTGDYVRYEAAISTTPAFADINLPTTQLDGKTGHQMTAGELSTAGSKITDQVDNPALGRVNLVFNVENVTEGTWFATIQGAIDDPGTLDGDTIQVDPGAYAERVTVDKKLTIEGPNMGTAGDNGARTAEAVIVPPSTDFGSDKNPVPLVKFMHGSDGSVLDGLEVNGDNPALTSGVHINGTDADPDAAFGIQIQNAKDVTIENNLVKNFSSPGTSSPGFPFAVAIYGSDSTGVISGILIKDNYIKNVNQSSGTPAVLDAVVLEFNAYGQITGNRMENVWEGVQINDHTVPNPEPSFQAKIDGNTILASRSGIYDNEQRSNASSWLLAGNHIESMAGPAGSNIFGGIRVETMDGTVSDTISDNTIVGNVKDRQQENSAFVVNGIVFKNDVSTTGSLVVKDNDISGVLDGIVYTTTTTSAQLSTKIKFEGGNIHDVKRDYVRYEILNGTTGVADANLPSTRLDGKTGRQYTTNELGGIESTKITDRVDDAALIGKVNLVLPVENITRGTWFADIQSAIDDPETQDGDVINVDPGTYTLTTGVRVTKSLSIQGNNLDLTDKPLITGVGGTAHKALFYVTAPNVTIRNFHLQFAEQDAAAPASVTSYGILTGDNGTFNNLTIADNLIEGTGSAYVFNSYGIFTGSQTGATSDKVTIVRNTLGHTGTDNALGRAIRTWHTYGTIGGSAADKNDLKGFYASIQNGVPGGIGAMVISYNTLQGKIEMNRPAAGTHQITANTITSGGTADAGGETAAQRQPALIEVISSTTPSASVVIKGNTLSDFQLYGVAVFASGNVSIEGNTFNPLANATGFKAVYFDTKTTNSGSVAAQTFQGLKITGNQFNGSGVSGGTGLLFANSNGAAGKDPLTGIVIGGAGADANTFSGELKTYISLSDNAGPSDGIAPWTPTSEYYSGTATTTAFAFSSDMDATGNKFGAVAPATATNADFYALENKIDHGIDNGLTGFVTVKAKTAFPATAAQTQNAFTVVPDQNYTVLVKGGTNLSSTDLTATKDITLSSEDGSVSLHGITMNGADKTLTLAKPLTLSGSLDLVAGVVATTSANLLTLAYTATFSAPVTDAYIDGPVRKYGGGAFIFPVGKGGTSAPLKVDGYSDHFTAYTAEYFNTAYKDLTYGSGLTGVSHREYWTFVSSEIDPVRVSLGTFDLTASGIADLTQVVAAEADPEASFGFQPLSTNPLNGTDNPLYVGGIIYGLPLLPGHAGIYTFGATGAQSFTTTTVSSIDMPADGTYKVGDVLTFIVHFSTDVSEINPEPQMPISLFSGTAYSFYDAPASHSDSLVFHYVVHAGDVDNNGIAAADMTLDGGIIKGSDDNDVDRTINHVNGGSGIRIDGVAPVISSVTIPDKAMNPGNTVIATITTASDADTYILASGTIGGFALSNLSKVDDTHYTATFTVGGGTPDIAAGDDIPVNLVLVDGAGNLSSPYTTPISQSGDAIYATVPVITSVDNPANGSYKAGKNLDFTVHYSSDVAVTGLPVIPLTIGASSVTAVYVPGVSDGKDLVFRYTVQDGDLDADGVTAAAAISGLIRGAGGNVADNSLALMPSNTEVLVDAVPPVVSSVTVPADSTYGKGKVLSFAVHFSEPVTVTGTDAALNLVIGSTARVAGFVSAAGDSVVFSYTVQDGETDHDGITVNSLSLNSSLIEDPTGNDADVTLKSIGATTGVLVDGAAPKVTSVSAPPDQTYGQGKTLTFTVHFSKAVTVTGSGAALDLTIGGASDSAAYVSGSGSNDLVFSYQVRPGDEDVDGIVVNALSLSATTVTGAAGNDADLTLAGVGATGGVKVDGIGPKVLSVTVPADSTYKEGDVMSFIVNFSEPVTVSGTAGNLAIVVGSTPETADYVSHTADAMTFSYMVQVGDEDSNGIAVSSLALNGSAITDAAGNDADTALVGVGSTLAVHVDAIPPKIASVSVPADSLYKAGDVLSFTVHFSEPVKMSGMAEDLDLMIGTTARKAAWVSLAFGSMVFSYTVQAGDVDGDGIAISSLSLNGSAITDTAGNSADVTLSGTAPTGGVLVDAVKPVIGGGTSFTVPENSPAGTVVGTLSVTPGGPGGTISWTIGDSSNPDSTFAITADGEIIVHDSAALDYEKQKSYAVVVTSTDGVNVSDPVTVNITVNDVDDAPTGITLSSDEIDENNAAGATAGTFTTADEDGSVFTYRLVSGSGDADNASFAVVKDQLTVAKVLDYEQQSSYSIRVRSTDEGGAFVEKVFTVTVKDVNEAPVMGATDDTSACATTDPGDIPLQGISGGPEKGQTCTVSVSADKDYFDALTADAVKDGKSTIHYTLSPDASGESHIRVTVKDDGGTAEGGIDTLVRLFTLTVNPLPVVSIAGGSDPVSNGDTVHLVASGGVSYSWDPAAGVLGGLNAATLAVRPQQNTTYRVTVTDDKGCSASGHLQVTVTDDYASIRPSNILTPNGDGKNDTWVIKNIDSYPDNEVELFDRSGRMIWHKKGYANDWNGTVNGRPLHEGTYYYLIDFGNGKKVLKGFISIIRDSEY